ncbi:MAG: NADH dehydrogenase [Elusimicrobia bacterium GWA2_56_46]|nr:MAG: NADH dehydrogenase [Elusimicrobia bacterium GWA2_56_46]OGR55988.1 MAG: NADH dehydrogenase [Elusimicrobia bacterium GWC2_56_31]HBB65930.1 NADH dehydrogenase FAD-containing subunit [Elusimicrobiota bacterium]HBW22372.1 NADH dehydrogenase FAD-containing subunit [Elusimicrobiota bacterium]
MINLLMLVPLLAGLSAFFIADDGRRRILLIASAALHLSLTICVIAARPVIVPGAWFALDPLGLLFLGVTSLLFLGASIYAVKYLSLEKRDPGEDSDEGFIFNNEPETVFTGCLLLFLAAMTAVTASRHLGILWAAVEATTLLSAPLIYFHRHKRSLEATWKYLLICSVGIAMALMGNLFLGAAGLRSGASLDLESLLSKAASLDQAWLKAAFLFLFVGYGTKMGLAPFHTWLPDAHSESPAVVSALLSGALLNCAFLGILRVAQVCAAAGLAGFTGGILILFGILSLMTAAFFILAQKDYKRMLAYSSIEHMGILSLGTGLGGGAVYGALLNAVSHSLTKAGLFFISGLILAAYKTKNIPDVKGLIRRAPAAGILWLAGFFLITGTPPSGIFLGKFMILKTAVSGGHYAAAAAFLFFLAVVFAGMGRIFLEMTLGEAPALKSGEKPFEASRQLLLPAACFFACAIALGLYMPAWLNEIITGARNLIGGAI